MLHSGLHLGNLERLADIVTRTFTDGLLGNLFVAVPRHQDHLAIIEHVLRLPQNLKAIHLVHLDVRDNQLRRNRLQLIQSFLGIYKGKCFVAELFARCYHKFDDLRLVINDYNLGHKFGMGSAFAEMRYLHP